MLRNDAPFFDKFGEVYFSFVNPGYIKGWKRHKEMTQHFAVPVGNLKLVMYDARTSMPTHGEIQELEIGVDNYCLVRIPPNVYYSFAAVGSVPAMIANCADIPHHPNESVVLDLQDDSIPYTWTK